MQPLCLVSLMADNMAIFYRRLAQWLSGSGGIPIVVEDGVPWQERERMLDCGEAHVGFICGLPYVRKVDRLEPLVELLAAPVMRRPRYQCRPIYFSDVVVRTDSDLMTLSDLRGSSWAYNEPGSQSGYNLIRFYLASIGEPSGYFSRVIESGAHQTSLQRILDGDVDASAIDSTVLELEFELQPQLADSVRVIHTFGPSSVPPAVASMRVGQAIRRKIRQLLLVMHDDTEGQEILSSVGIERFVSVRDQDYDDIREMARVADGVCLGPSDELAGNRIFARIGT